MSTKRLFAFGCSFTNYYWSTWADCLAPEYDSFENWGQPGGGNHYIFNSVMEADQRHLFTNGDVVIVCWTSVDREDRYVEGRWHTPGNAHFAINVYNPEYLKTHWDERGWLIRDLAYIKSVKTLLETRPGVHWKFLSMEGISPIPWPEDNHESLQDVMQLYQDVIEAIHPSYDQTVFKDTGWPNRNGNSHPSPAQHLEYLDTVLPGYVTLSKTRNRIAEETANLESIGYAVENNNKQTIKRL
jgi:hypothetical protein